MSLTQKIILSLSILLSNFSYAETSQVKIQAKTLSGCNLNAKDISFGNVILRPDMNNKAMPLLDVDFKIQCSNNTTISLGTTSINNPARSNGSYLTKNGQKISGYGSLNQIQYRILTNNIQSNALYSVTGRPSYDWLVSTTTFYLGLKILTPNQISLPLKATISTAIFTFNTNDFTNVTPGDYSDTMTYEATF